jgi:hypothetical protein
MEISVRSPLTLKHDNQTTISIVHAAGTGESHSGGTIEIRRTGTSRWYTLGAESELSPWTAKIAGTFELRATATVNGKTYTTPEAEVEVRFPSYGEITSDSTVLSFASEAWTATLSDCTPTERRERGFWIFLNTGTDEYEAGPTVLGPNVGNSVGAYVNLPLRPQDSPSLPSPIEPSARYPVASFHCHTATTYREWGRGIGPSPADNQADSTDKVPGIVYDYEDFPERSGSIPAGHPLNAPAKIYKSLGFERRPTP